MNYILTYSKNTNLAGLDFLFINDILIFMDLKISKWFSFFSFYFRKEEAS